MAHNKKIYFSEMLKNYKYISFDIFDTLIKRIVPCPSDVFLLIDEELKKKEINVNDFYYNRKNAERIVRKKYTKEITLDEIYEELSKIYPNEICKIAKQIEIDIELDVCYPNPEIVSIYKDCVADGKNVYLISDMYLPREVIEKILYKANIKSYKKLFISCESGKTKADGSLFYYVKEKENIDIVTWCHIGDNRKSDKINPEKIGIASILIRDDIELNGNKYKNESIHDLMLNRYAKINAKHIKDAFEKIGYELYGPLLFKFIVWLRNELVSNSIKNVLFCARDGYYFKKAYESLYGRYDTNLVYFFVSRKSLIHPYVVVEKDIDNIYSTMWINIMPKKFTIATWIKKFGFINVDDNDIYPYTMDTVVCRDKIIKETSFTEVFKRLVSKHKEVFAKEKEALDEYLRQNINDTMKKMAIVDLGWHGSTQAVLEKILDRKLWGYYLSFCDDTIHFENVRGFLADNIKSNDPVSLIAVLLELVFSAPHGSVEKYCLTNKKVTFKFASYEHEGDNDDISRIRKGMMKFIDDITLCNILMSKKYTKSSMLVKAGLSPSRDFLSMMENFKFLDGEVKRIFYIREKYIYLRHPVLLIKDLARSPWRVGFVSKLLGTSFGISSFFILLKRSKRILYRL